jgi:hypothetical protein
MTKSQMLKALNGHIESMGFGEGHMLVRARNWIARNAPPDACDDDRYVEIVWGAPGDCDKSCDNALSR